MQFSTIKSKEEEADNKRNLHITCVQTLHMYKNKGTKSNSSMYQKIHMVRKTEENPRVKTGLVDQVKFLVELSYHSNQHAKLREINSTMKNLDQYLDHLVTV